MTHAAAMLQAGSEIVQLDGILLDERRWDDWLDLYTDDCTFWLPMWRDEEQMNDSTEDGLAHMYYQNRKGIEDRITRIRTGKSPVSSPLPRTAHLVSSIVLQGEPGPERINLRATWACHVLFTRARAQHAFFGRSEYALAQSSGRWKIKSKKVLLQNDDIPGVLDVYCV
jgi:3-phenylpropionate/cinnamic acid dioxygenase small subunit